MISVNRPPLSRHIHVKTPIARMRHNLTIVYNRLAFLSTSSPLSPSRGLHVFTLVKTFHCAHIPRRPEVGSERSPCAFTAVAQATRHQIASPHFPPELLPACYFNMVDKMLLSQSFKSLLHGPMVQRLALWTLNPAIAVQICVGPVYMMNIAFWKHL